MNSTTPMAATGTVLVNGDASNVTGTAWFDHQWGDFIAVGGGGWDWFAVNLDDVVDRTVRLLSQLTRQVAIVQYPTLSRSTVSRRHAACISSAHSSSFKSCRRATWRYGTTIR